MALNHPLITKWSLVLWAEVPMPPTGGIGQQKVAEDKEVYEYVDKVLKFLTTRPEAVTYRDMYAELEEIGAKAQARIEKELRKRVAPQSSSPVKEPGSPFG
jgi:hypothetical protein